LKKEKPLSYFLKTRDPDQATGVLKDTYAQLESMFQMIPKVFVAQSIRPDLLEPIVTYVNRLLIETHALSRGTKELIAAHVSKLNNCEY
jgi:alkylhydroperoxidase family enzyme